MEEQPINSIAIEFNSRLFSSPWLAIVSLSRWANIARLDCHFRIARTVATGQEAVGFNLRMQCA